MELLRNVGIFLGVVIYATPVVPMWCFAYFGSRPRRTRLASWALASVMATFWPVTLTLAYVGVRMTTTREQRELTRRAWKMDDRISAMENEFRTATAPPVVP
jgi:cbb3-type cytochrome oxidase subunit 1